MLENQNALRYDLLICFFQKCDACQDPFKQTGLLISMISFYVNEDNKATIVCPGCGKSKVIDASKYMGGDGPVKIKFKFKCGYCAQKQKKMESSENKVNPIHIITLERRKFYRKKVNLPGIFIDPRGKKAGILIIDVSRTGLKFKLEFPWPVRCEDVISVEFCLDNAAKTLIKKKARVKKIEDLMVSAEFFSMNTFSESDKAIGFYLMN